MKNGTTGAKPDLQPNSKPYLLKRIISDGFDTVLIFMLFMLFSALIFNSPLADAYNAHRENCKAAQDAAAQEYGEDMEKISEALKKDAYYGDEQFAANLNGYVLKLLAGFAAEAAVLLIVPLISANRGTPGKLMTGIIPFNEKKQVKAPASAIAARFAFVFIIEGALPYLLAGILTFLLIPVIRFTEMLLNKNNRTICDALTGITLIEKLSYDGIDKKTEEKS